MNASTIGYVVAAIPMCRVCVPAMFAVARDSITVTRVACDDVGADSWRCEFCGVSFIDRIMEGML